MHGGLVACMFPAAHGLMAPLKGQGLDVCRRIEGGPVPCPGFGWSPFQRAPRSNKAFFRHRGMYTLPVPWFEYLHFVPTDVPSIQHVNCCTRVLHGRSSSKHPASTTCPHLGRRGRTYFAQRGASRTALSIIQQMSGGRISNFILSPGPRY